MDMKRAFTVFAICGSWVNGKIGRRGTETQRSENTEASLSERETWGKSLDWCGGFTFKSLCLCASVAE
jgi:hypothetical protein